MPEERLISTKNEYIKFLRTLGSRRARAQSGLFIVTGEKCVTMALENAAVERVLYSGAYSAAGVPATAVSDAIIAAIAEEKTPQSVLAVVRIPECESPERLAARLSARERSVVVVLDGVSDPGNVGTIIRTADAAGADAVLLSEGCADVWSQRTTRAAMGSNMSVPLAFADTPALLAALKATGYMITAGHLRGGDKLQQAARTALVIGNESRGISPEAERFADCLYRLPMRGRAESLNASVAAGILIYKACGLI